MRIKLVAGVFTAFFTLTTAAVAETHVGWYVAGEAGLHQLSTQHLSVTDVAVSSSESSSVVSETANSSSSSSSSTTSDRILNPLATQASEDDTYSLRTKQGAAYFLRLGYQFTPHWRIEGELGDRQGTIHHSIIDDNTSESSSAGRGSIDMSSAMLNVLYDIAPDSKLHPYIGLGGGAVSLRTRYTGTIGSTGSAIGDPYNITTTYSNHQKKTQAAWQVIAGLTWALSDRLNLDLTYRYLDAGKTHYDVHEHSTYQYDVVTDDGCDEETACCAPIVLPEGRISPHFNADTLSTVSVVEDDSLKTSSKLHDNSVSIGLRWAFGDARPPAPMAATAMESDAPPATVPAAPPVDKPVVSNYGPPETPPAQAFTVYFAFDRSALSDSARTAINDAAQFALSAPSPRVTVTGHTDTAGSSAYNIALSQRRAQAVADGLTADGVSGADIKLGWTGEKDLAVPTANGTPEPENRRTTIDVAF